MQQPQDHIFVVDIQDAIDVYNSAPIGKRRPDSMVPEDYSDAEVAKMEIESLFPHIVDYRTKVEGLRGMSEGILDGLQYDMPGYGNMDNFNTATGYVGLLSKVGLAISEVLKDNEMYDQRGFLIVDYFGLEQGHILLLKERPPVVVA